jgi:hypothetical protein
MIQFFFTVWRPVSGLQMASFLKSGGNGERTEMTSAAQSVEKATRQALEAGEGILRLAPTWVPRSYMVPGRRLKLDSRDLYAYGTQRGGIDERWFASTTFAMNEGRTPDEGLSFIVSEGARFTLKDAVAAEGSRLIGEHLPSLARLQQVL